MSVIDDYLNTVNSEQRAELERIRAIALEMLPGAEEVIAYDMPTIKYHGNPILAFGARKKHIGIYPYSGSVIQNIKELDGYDTTKGAIREKIDEPLPKLLIQKLIRARLEQVS